MADMVTLKIDQQIVTVPAGTLIVDAARKAGINIPVFCYHPKMEPVGMVPYGPAKRRISVRYYLIAVLFILFDIEVVFLVPWAVVIRQIGVPGLVFMIIFVLILEVAHLYAWKKGALEWD